VKLVFLRDVNRCTDFNPGDGECDQHVGEFTEREQRAAEYEAESSADVAQQSQQRIRRFSLDVHVLQLREKHLRQSPQHDTIRL